jgi:hypothetical protein
MTVRRASEAWNRFWFAPVATSTLVLVRVAFALTTLLWTVSLLPELGPLFSRHGVLPRQPASADPGLWGLLAIWRGDVALSLAVVVLATASVALLVGCWTRLSAALVFAGILTLQRRDPFVFNAGDVLLRTTAFYLMLAPAGAALSVDAWRRHGRFALVDFPSRAPWALRLIQIQLTIVYLSTVWAKARGQAWNDGTAVSYALRLTDLSRFPVPDELARSAIVANVLTYGTLATELAIAVLIWNRASRPYVIGLGIALHAGIDYSIRVGFFAPALFTSYVAFVPPERATAFIGAIARRLAPGPVDRVRLPERAVVDRK